MQIHDEALVKAVDLSIRYIAERRLPDKAIDILDEACSRLRIQIDSMPTEMDKLISEINQLEIERTAIGSDKTGSKAREKISAQITKARQEFSEAEKVWEKHKLLLDRMRRFESKKSKLDTSSKK